MDRHDHRFSNRHPSPLDGLLLGLNPEDDTLVNHDRTLLAEPLCRFQWSDNGGVGTVAPGRLSLPSSVHRQYSHRPSHVPQDIVREEPPRYRRPPMMAQYPRTPQYRVRLNSSPVCSPPSSPLYNVSQRLSTARYTGSTQGPLQRQGASLTSNSSQTRSSIDSTRTSQMPMEMHRERPTIPRETPSFTMTPKQILLPHAPPIVQGIELRPLDHLPDRLRSVFRFNPFNAIQSKCFPVVYESSDNLLVSAPTGSGKTAVLELAICNLMSNFNVDQFKVVYMAPTKSLCSERCRDWQAKFVHLDLTCAELTGDTDNAHLRNVQGANIIITTPEKWDSMTRQWKDHAKLLQMVKLFLIDEVHILRERRGATLESVVSRMKSIGSKVRFVALSATVPNPGDVATWLGRNHDDQNTPAISETFDEEFRPVKLEKHVVGIPYQGNDFGFENVCDPKLADIIAKYGKRKPVMIFCVTRKAAVSTAKRLANIWASKDRQDRPWPTPTRRLSAQDAELLSTLSSAVAFHHAGLDLKDRNLVEKGYRDGEISVICCTSTLAVGVNLPCHLVVIKNTVGYQGGSLKEYSDLEIMQMLGRAGRPQYDDSAVAVILTKQQKLAKYERLVSGTELLESCLHLNLIEHLNAEIALGTIHDVNSAKKWLRGTFLYVRLEKNPEHYKLDDTPAQGGLDDKVKSVCQRDITLLASVNLVTSCDVFRCTEFGQIMARYYVKFTTMKSFLNLGDHPRLSDILSVVVQAEEFELIRLKTPERKLFKEINSHPGIKFPIKVNLALHAHKRSLLIQSELSGLDYPIDEEYARHKRQFQLDTQLLFSNIPRLIRCIVDIQIQKQDATGTRNALELARSFDAHAWDDSALQMKQIKTIGPVSIRKLVTNGIRSIEDLEAVDAQRIELLLSRSSPYGMKLIAMLADFPKLRVSLKLMGKEIKKGRLPMVNVKIEAGCMNDKIPSFFNGKPIYVCLLTERSDGHLIDFRRISSKKIGNSSDILISAQFTGHQQYLVCYIMCDAIAGTLRCAKLKPDLPPYIFPKAPAQKDMDTTNLGDPTPKVTAHDNFDMDGFNDQELIDMCDRNEFKDIDVVEISQQKTHDAASNKKRSASEPLTWDPTRLENGKWACNHNCKDKGKCRHLCCREGLDKMPKAPKRSCVTAGASNTDQSHVTGNVLPENTISTKTSLKMSDREDTEHKKGRVQPNIRKSPWDGTKMPRGHRRLELLHDSTTKRQISARDDQSTNVGQGRLDHFSGRNLHSISNGMALCGSDESFEEFPSPSKLVALEDSKITQPRVNDDVTEGIQDNSLVQNAALYGSSFGTDYGDPISTHDVVLGFDEKLPATRESLERPVAEESQELQSVSKFFRASTDDPAPAVTSAPAGAGIETWQEQDFGSIPSPQDGQKPSSGNISPPAKRQKLVETVKDDSPTCMTDAVVAEVKNAGPVFKPIQPTSTSAGKNPEPVIKPGFPAWVYDMDPAFIAEWQDIVKFV